MWDHHMVQLLTCVVKVLYYKVVILHSCKKFCVIRVIINLKQPREFDLNLLDINLCNILFCNNMINYLHYVYKMRLKENKKNLLKLKIPLWIFHSILFGHVLFMWIKMILNEILSNKCSFNGQGFVLPKPVTFLTLQSMKHNKHYAGEKIWIDIRKELKWLALIYSIFNTINCVKRGQICGHYDFWDKPCMCKCLTWECVVLLYQDPLPWLPLLPRWPFPSSSPRAPLLLLWWWRWWWWWCPRRPERGDPTGEVWVSEVTDDLFKQFDGTWVWEERSESALLLLPEPGWTQNMTNSLTC